MSWFDLRLSSNHRCQSIPSAVIYPDSQITREPSAGLIVQQLNTSAAVPPRSGQDARVYVLKYSVLDMGDSQPF